MPRSPGPTSPAQRRSGATCRRSSDHERRTPRHGSRRAGRRRAARAAALDGKRRAGRAVRSAAFHVRDGGGAAALAGGREHGSRVRRGRRGVVRADAETAEGGEERRGARPLHHRRREHLGPDRGTGSPSPDRVPPPGRTAGVGTGCFGAGGSAERRRAGRGGERLQPVTLSSGSAHSGPRGAAEGAATCCTTCSGGAFTAAAGGAAEEVGGAAERSVLAHRVGVIDGRRSSYLGVRTASVCFCATTGCLRCTTRVRCACRSSSSRAMITTVLFPGFSGSSVWKSSCTGAPVAGCPGLRAVRKNTFR